MKAVLVVEDHPLVAEAASQLLKQQFKDIDVVMVRTATDALRAIDESRGCWFRILLDLAVPGAFGLSLAKQICDRDVAICCVVSACDRATTCSNSERGASWAISRSPCLSQP